MKGAGGGGGGGEQAHIVVGTSPASVRIATLTRHAVCGEQGHVNMCPIEGEGGTLFAFFSTHPSCTGLAVRQAHDERVSQISVHTVRRRGRGATPTRPLPHWHRQFKKAQAGQEGAVRRTNVQDSRLRGASPLRPPPHAHVQVQRASQWQTRVQVHLSSVDATVTDGSSPT